MVEVPQELELEIESCSHLILNFETPFWLNLGASNATTIDVARIPLKSEKDVICNLTEKPCVLYNRRGGAFHLFPHINYDFLKRCPSSEEIVKRYKLKGVKEEHDFYVDKIERIEE